jgi:hypothetical protein
VRVTGKRIPLSAEYWSVARQEPYAAPDSPSSAGESSADCEARDLLAAALALPAGAAHAAPPLTVVRSRPVQGGYAVCDRALAPRLLLDGAPVGTAPAPASR